MARPGQINHVEVGLNQVPEKLRANRIQRYLAVYLDQYNSLENAVQALIEAFFTWQSSGEQLDFVLEIIGALFNQPRPDGFTREQYAFILRARVLSRRSEGTEADVYRVAKFLAKGQPVSVHRIVPKTIVVTVTDLQATMQERALYRQILLDTVDAVDDLHVQTVVTGTAFYDVGEYDAELYAP